MFTVKDLKVYKTKSVNKYYLISELNCFIVGAWNVENSDIFKLTIILTDPKKLRFDGISKKINQEYDIKIQPSRTAKHALIVEKFNLFLESNRYNIIDIILG